MALRFCSHSAVCISVLTLCAATLTAALPSSLYGTLLSRDRVECDPADAFDIVTFFLLNFLTHVATVKSFPGTNFATTVKWSLAIFLLPYSGIVRGCIAIARGRKPGETELQQAARSGALAYVARGKNWRPRAGDRIKKVGFRTETTGSSICSGEFHLWAFDDNGLDRLSLEENLFHGQIDNRLWEEGYDLRLVQAWHDVEPIYDTAQVHLGNEPSWTKALAAIVQLGSACFTLYQARGEQLERYGYAAFGLAVIPYAVMSLVNLCAAAVNADYPAIYLVNTPIMDEAVSRGLKFSGVVGRIRTATTLSSSGLRTIKVTRYREWQDSETNEWHQDFRFEPIMVTKSGTAEKSVSEDTSSLYYATENFISFFDRQSGTYDSTFSSRLPDNGGIQEREPSSINYQTGLADVEIQADGLLRTRWTPAYHSSPALRALGNCTARHWIALAIGITGLVAPYIVIAGLTDGFKQGASSSLAQRAWIMSWLVCGSVFGVAVGTLLAFTPDTRWALMKRAFPLLAVLAAPAIGGCVMVAQEMLEFGSCTAVG